MKSEQRIVVGWMKAQMGRLGWKSYRWAKEAKVSPTSLTRAMSDEYPSVSTLPTLHALARAARVPSILDFLEQQTNGLGSAPTAREVHAMLAGVLPAVGMEMPDDADLERVAEAMSFGLTIAMRDPTLRADDIALRVAVDAAAARLHT